MRNAECNPMYTKFLCNQTFAGWSLSLKTEHMRKFSSWCGNFTGHTYTFCCLLLRWFYPLLGEKTPTVFAILSIIRMWVWVRDTDWWRLPQTHTLCTCSVFTSRSPFNLCHSAAGKRSKSVCQTLILSIHQIKSHQHMEPDLHFIHSFY